MAKGLESETVLFVDDEESILNALRRELADEEYRCLFALSGNQALKILQQEDVSVIVSDMKMPEMDGLRLLKLVREKYPATVRIVLSGYTQLPQILVTINQAEIFKFLTKPWGEELKSVIIQSIAYHQMLTERTKLEQILSMKYDQSTSVVTKIENVVLAARNSGAFYSTLGITALEMAAETLDNPDDSAAAKEQLAMASAMLMKLSTLDFEEYSTISVGVFCENLRRRLLHGNVKDYKVEETKALMLKIRTRPRLLGQFISYAAEALTGGPHEYAVSVKANAYEEGQSGKLELIVLISELGGAGMPGNGIQTQKLFLDMCNRFASRALAVLNGDFQGIITNNTVILKIIVNDYSKHN